jgi:prepilin-type N-terminal cleavage/methylation domain-containing protein
MTRKAFTLIEVMVALVVTGLVVSMAYATVQAGFETSERLASTQSGEERETVARAMLSRAIRHAVPGSLGGQPVFVLRNSPLGDELVFRTRGVIEPNGASQAWDVELISDANGVRFSGRSIGDSSLTFSTLLPRLQRIDVRVRGRDFRDGWFEEWPFVDRSPVAVMIALLDSNDRAIGAPLVARVGLEGNP